jgi:uncharacterized protein with GYD domain
MPKYLLEVSYTLDGIRGVKAKGGSARRAAADEAVRSAGGKLESLYFAFGDTDVYAVAELPDNTAAAGVALAITAAGGAQVKTVVLASPEEIDAAAAIEIGYRPPGS